jgi:opacity protein-like surface antigen
MSNLSRRLGVALVSTSLSTLLLAALCLGTRTVHAQAAPVAYWIPSWPIGFGGDLTDSPDSNTYGNFPSFGHSGARGGGFSHMRYHFPNGWFVGTEAGGMGSSMNGINQPGAFGNIRSHSYEGVQFGYNFQTVGNLPITVYAGFNTLKYNPGIGDPFASFDSSSSTLPGYGVNAGVEFQPTSNLSLSLGFGYTQQPGRLDGINSLASPFGLGGRH